MDIFLLQSCPSKLSPETFLAFRISAMDRLTEDTYCVRFALPRNCQLGLRPGQHLILRYIQVVGGQSFAAPLGRFLAVWLKTTCLASLEPLLITLKINVVPPDSEDSGIVFS